MKDACTRGSAMRLIRRFIKDRSGATAIEYALVASLISIVIVLGVTSIGDQAER